MAGLPPHSLPGPPDSSLFPYGRRRKTGSWSPPQDHWDKWNLRDKVGLQAELLCVVGGVGAGGELG